MIKQNDVALIILISSIALAASWFIAGSLINTPENRSQEVEKVRPISSDFTIAPESVFNENAINPTEAIKISENDKDKPFVDSEE
ncbi:MAG: hypothetical protein R3313_04950 [Candidatus Saccharimonadales bacterium]|nr:hypothetical protein [Candidatus Saccharimonadales bacterium]